MKRNEYFIVDMYIKHELAHPSISHSWSVNDSTKGVKHSNNIKKKIKISNYLYKWKKKVKNHCETSKHVKIVRTVVR